MDGVLARLSLGHLGRWRARIPAFGGGHDEIERQSRRKKTMIQIERKGTVRDEKKMVKKKSDSSYTHTSSRLARGDRCWQLRIGDHTSLESKRY